MNTKFKRVLALVLCLAMAVTVFVGCGKKVSDKDEQGRTVVTIGGYPAEGTKARTTFDEKLAKFSAANPDIAVTPLEWSFDIKAFYSQAAGGQLPTLFQTNYTEVNPAVNAGYIADITDILKGNGFYDNLNPQILDALSPDGNVYSFPMSSYVLGLWVNIDMFEKAGLMQADGTPMQPKTWDEFAEFCVKIKKATGKAGFALSTTSNVGGWLFTPIAWSFGGKFVEENEDGTYTAVFNSPECAAALQFIKDLRWKYDVLPQDSLVDYDKRYQMWATGEAAMLIDEHGASRYALKYDMDINNMGAIALPAGPAKHVTLLGGSTYMIPKTATKDQQKAVMKWIEQDYDFRASETVTANTEKSYKTQAEEGQLVGTKDLSIWSTDSEYLKMKHGMIEKYTNVNPNHIKLYNDFVTNCPAEIRPEERICAQELYGILDKCIQEVINNKDADVAAVLEKANSDFQHDYLDNY